MYKQLLLSYSYSPAIDIGQVEGAFVMGLGLYLYEEIKYDPKNGQNITSDLWVRNQHRVLLLPLELCSYV